VVDTARARELAAGNPDCFLRVTRPELELDPGTPTDAPESYARAALNYRRFCADGVLMREAAPALYLYRLKRDGRAQTGVVATCSADDYDRGVIRRHELTRARPEADRTRHILSTGAQTGPVFLAFRDDPGAAALIAGAARAEPLYDFTAADGVQHTVWKIPAPAPWAEAFARIPCAYIADGHHRASAAARIARERGAERAGAPADAPWRSFLAVLFPASELRIMPYHRVVADLGGRSPDAFRAALEKNGFRVSPAVRPEPEHAGSAGLFMEGRWWRMEWQTPAGADVVARLDASVLQERMFGPLLDIADPRQSERIAFVGGIHGAAELERKVRAGEFAAAFALHAVTMEALMAVSDAGRVMPPKSTWFEPKLRDGLLVHEIGD
jgi:uncharacterized protein (DUF1015 family)